MQELIGKGKKVNEFNWERKKVNEVNWERKKVNGSLIREKIVQSKVQKGLGKKDYFQIRNKKIKVKN